jgi:multicomponent K+:H+ antiporter subunit G
VPKAARLDPIANLRQKFGPTGLVDFARGALKLVAVSVCLVAFGLARLPDLFMRLHGPTKATTLGLGGIVLAAMLQGGTLAPLAISLFLFITAPVVAHLVAKAAIRERDHGGD